MNLLLVHIAIAVGSILLLTLALIKPSELKINLGYVMISATLGSGTYLVISTGAPLKSSCISGITYIAVATIMTYLAQRRLAQQQI